MAFAQSELSSF